MNIAPTDYETLRLVSRILNLYYLENLNQAEIAKLLGLSTPKVNRLLKQARVQGMIEIKLHIPFQHILDLEKRIHALTGVKAVVTPSLSEDPLALMQMVGKAAADYLLEQVRDGDTICTGGGNTLYTLVQAVHPTKPVAVTVVPATGGVQGRHGTDVNNLAAELANQLGGQSFQLHAPAFADSPAERDAVIQLRHVSEMLDRARSARIAVFGIGTLTGNSSYFNFTSLSPQERTDLVENTRGVGEILARVLDENGLDCAPQYSRRVIGINLKDIHNIPLTIGLAANVERALAVAAVLRGNLVKTIVMDETTAARVVEIMDSA